MTGKFKNNSGRVSTPPHPPNMTLLLSISVQRGLQMFIMPYFYIAFEKNILKNRFSRIVIFYTRTIKTGSGKSYFFPSFSRVMPARPRLYILGYALTNAIFIFPSSYIMNSNSVAFDRITRLCTFLPVIT